MQTKKNSPVVEDKAETPDTSKQTKPQTAKKAPVAKIVKKRAAVKKRGRPGKKAAAAKTVAVKKRGRPSKKVPAKAALKRRGRPAKAQAARGKATSPGRPVSVETLQRKLVTAVDALKREKEKRRDQAKKAKTQIAALMVQKKKLKKLQKQFAESKQGFLKQDAIQRQVKKEAARAQKMQAAKEQAMAKWEKQYLAAEAKKGKGRKRRKPGRRK